MLSLHMDLSVIIPVYNEESRIGHSLERITAYFNPLDFEYEIIIIDDGSKDNTLSVIQAFNQNIHPLKIYNYMQNRGKGYAVRYGMLKGTGKYRLFTDADLSTPIQEVQSILGYLDQGYDICIASRAVADSNVIKHQPFHRETMGIIYNRIIRLTLSLPFYDTQCGFKCIKGAVADIIFPKLCVDRFAFDVELLYAAQCLGYTAKEVGTKWMNSPETKVSLVSDSLKMLGAILKIRYHAMAGRYNQ